MANTQRVAIVTGSRRGIGLGIAKALLAQGYFTVLSGVTEIGDQRADFPELSEYEHFTYIRCDISKPDDRMYILDETFKRYGRIDVLVNNAGVAPLERVDILETSSESFDRLIEINLKGTFFMSQAAAKLMIEMKHAADPLPDYAPRIVNISSVSAYTASISRGEYCISKAGIAMITQLFAARLADEGIPVFEVRPGIIMTDMTAGVKEKYEQLIADGITPIKRMGSPEDVAGCVVAACSGHLDFGTGTVLNADGGFHIRRL